MSQRLVEVVEEVDEEAQQEEDPLCESLESVRACGEQLRGAAVDIGASNNDVGRLVLEKEEGRLNRNCQDYEGGGGVRSYEKTTTKATLAGPNDQERGIDVRIGENILPDPPIRTSIPRSGLNVHHDALLSKQPVLLPKQHYASRCEEVNVFDNADHAQMGETYNKKIVHDGSREQGGSHDVCNMREKSHVQMPASAEGQVLGLLNAKSRETPEFVHHASAAGKGSVSCEDSRDCKSTSQDVGPVGSGMTLAKPPMLRSQPLANAGHRQSFAVPSAAMGVTASLDGTRQHSLALTAIPDFQYQNLGRPLEEKQKLPRDEGKCASNTWGGANASVHAAKTPLPAIANGLVQQRDRDEKSRSCDGQLPSVVNPSQFATSKGKFRIPRSIPIPSSLVPAPSCQTQRDLSHTKATGASAEQLRPAPKVQSMQNPLSASGDGCLSSSIKSSATTPTSQRKGEPLRRPSNSIGLLLNPTEDLSSSHQFLPKAETAPASTSSIGNSLKAILNNNSRVLPDHIPDVAVSQKPHFSASLARVNVDVQVLENDKQGQNLNQTSDVPQNLAPQSCAQRLKELKDEERTPESIVEPFYTGTAISDGCETRPEVASHSKSVEVSEAHPVVGEIPNHVDGRGEAIHTKSSTFPVPAISATAIPGSNEGLNVSGSVLIRGRESETQQEPLASVGDEGERQLCERASHLDFCTMDIETELIKSTQCAAKDIRAMERSGQAAQEVLDVVGRGTGTVAPDSSQNTQASVVVSEQNRQEHAQDLPSMAKVILPTRHFFEGSNMASQVTAVIDKNDKSMKSSETANNSAPNPTVSTASLAEDVALSSSIGLLVGASHAADLPKHRENARNVDARPVAEIAPQCSNLQRPSATEPLLRNQTLAGESVEAAQTQDGCNQVDQHFKPPLLEPFNLSSLVASQNREDSWPARDTTRNNQEAKGAKLFLKLRLKDSVTKESVLNRASEKEPTEMLRAPEPMQSEQKDNRACTERNRTSANCSTGGDRLEKEQSLKRRRSTKQPNKRKVNHVNHIRWDQDKAGRLTKPIIFPDSSNPVTLSNYKRKALSFEEEVWDSVRKDKTMNVASSTKIVGEGDWKRSPDALEELFWNALERGMDGKALTVPYGVDVEVEGAFDSTGMSYVEWYGVGDIDSAAKKDRRKNSGKRKLKGEPQVSNAANSGSMHLTANATCDREACNLKGLPDTSLKSRGNRGGDGREIESKQKPLLFAGHYSHVGNLNTKGLLRHMPRMPGINHSMYYIGQLFSRFCWHTEDAFLNSVSYLHQGSAEKIWYAVPPEFANQFEEYATESVFSDNLLDEYGTGQALLMNKTTIFDPRKLRGRGIQVYRVVHKPGSFVLTAPRAYHAGFNCGFNIAEAVNFANPTWFPVGREASRFARQIAKPLCVPWEYLLFHEAKATRDDSMTKKRAREVDRISKNAAILASELEMVTRKGERCIQMYAEKTNCRIAMLGDVDVLVQKNQLGPEFGHGAGMVCSMCGHACHFYAEICGSCDDSFEARCVEHFGEGHRLCLVPEHKTMLVRRHDPVMVADILKALEDLAGIQRTPSELLERYTGYLRPWETPIKRSGLRLKLNFKLAASRLLPVLAGGGSKYPKHGSQKERGKRGRKRMEKQVVCKEEESDKDHETVQKPKRRKSEKERPEPNKRPKSGEPLAAEPSAAVGIMPKVILPGGDLGELPKADLEGFRTLQMKIRRESSSADHISDVDCVVVKGRRRK